MSKPKSYRIGDLARELDVPVENIRYYEHAGLMPAPARSTGNYRLYGEAEHARLFFIKRCRSLDMTLEEVRRLLELRDAPGKSCAEVDALLDAHIEHVAERMAELRRLRVELRQLRARCGPTRSEGMCAILDGLSQVAPRTRAPARRELGHVHRSHKPRAHSKAGGQG
jgi:Cd(II)/Pb(II)-responsive transcriptional regulator